MASAITSKRLKGFFEIGVSNALWLCRSSGPLLCLLAAKAFFDSGIASTISQIAVINPVLSQLGMASYASETLRGAKPEVRVWIFTASMLILPVAFTCALISSLTFGSVVVSFLLALANSWLLITRNRAFFMNASLLTEAKTVFLLNLPWLGLLLAGWLQAIEWGGKISIFQELAICTCLLILGIKKIDFQRLVLTLSEACATNFEKFIFLMPYFQHQVAEMAIASRLLGLASALISKRSRDYLLSIRNRHQFRNIRWIHRACVVSCALLIASYPLGNFIGQGKVWLLSIPLIVVQIISANAIGILLDWKFFAGVEASARMRQRKLRFFVFLLLGQVILAAVTISMMSRYETNFLFYVPSTILIFALPLISKL